MSFDVFISYASTDKAIADATCAALEAAQVRCWIAPRDVLPGADWSASIIDALDNCRAMVLIFSAKANDSPQIRNEVARAVQLGVPVIPVRIEDIPPAKSLAYFIGAVHWLDAVTPPIETHLKRLAENVKALLQAAWIRQKTDASSARMRGRDSGRILLSRWPVIPTAKGRIRVVPLASAPIIGQGRPPPSPAGQLSKDGRLWFT